MDSGHEHKQTVSPSARAQPRSKRRRLAGPDPAYCGGQTNQIIDLTTDADEEYRLPHKPEKSVVRNRNKIDGEEKRLRLYRKKPPQTYIQRLHRAQSQRMFVIQRTRKGSEESPEEIVEIAGSTGNCYTVAINKMPTCTCPDSIKGNQCKHIIYILCNVLKAPTHLRYQLAYLSSELREILGRAPINSFSRKLGRDLSSNRKPVEGDCPICFTEFSPSTDDIVYCKASCGNNVHKECFQQWIRSQIGEEVRCVYCRSAWTCDEETFEMIQKLLEKRKDMAVNEEGYINVAQELGISRARDYSTYHQPWVRSQGRSVRFQGVF